MGVVVRKKVNGSNIWWVFVSHKGRRTSKRVGTRRNAEKVAEHIEAQLKLGLLPGKGAKRRAPTLESYYGGFQQTYLQTAVKETTRDSYDTNFRVHILPVLGHLTLDEITRLKVKEFIAILMKKKLSKSSIGIITRELCAVLNHAIEDKVIQENPASRVSKYFKQAPTRHAEIEPLTDSEARLFLKKAYAQHRRYYPFFLCAINTGMRLGELLGLQWGDTDFAGKFLTIRRTVVRGKITTTKTNRTRRVDLSDALLYTLTELKKQRKEEWLAKGYNEIPPWVFCNLEGNPLDPFNLKYRHFLKCLEQCGLRRIRFHDLRHTFASLLIQNGEPLAYIKEQLGHSSIKMTVDVYGHLEPGALREAVNKLPSLDYSKPIEPSSKQARNEA